VTASGRGSFCVLCDKPGTAQYPLEKVHHHAATTGGAILWRHVGASCPPDPRRPGAGNQPA